jgi:capsular exopolysaccharide synthesis family protein
VPSPTLPGKDGFDAGSAPEAGSGAEPGTGVSPTKVWHALRRRWLVALPLAAAMAALVAGVAENRLTPVYTVRTLVHVGTNSPSILYDNLGGYSDQRTQIATVKSRLVRQTAVKDLAPLDLAVLRSKADPVGWLEKEIQADFTIAPEILRITLKGANPDELVLLLDGIRDAYLREVINKDRSERAARLDSLTHLASTHAAALKEARQKLSHRVEAYGVQDYPELRAKHAALTTQLNTLQTELLLALASGSGGDGPPPAREGEAWPDSGQAAPEPVPDPAFEAALETALEAALGVDRRALESRADIRRLEKVIANLKRLKDYQTDTEYIKAADEMAAARAGEAERREALRPGVVANLRRAAGEARPLPPPAVGVGTGRAGVAPYRIPVLRAEIKKKEQEVAALAKECADLGVVREEIDRQERQLDLVNSKARPLEVELQAPPRARVLEEAVVVESPKADRWIKVVVAPAGAAFVLVLGFVAWLDLRRGPVDGRADLEAVRIRVLGAVPSVRPAVLLAFTPPDQNAARQEYLHLADSLDMARAVLAPVVAETRGYVLAVTSAAAGEGKTVLAGHLAVRFARSGLKTLLIDADLRRPQLHRLFGLALAPGLGEWVTGAAERGAVVRPGPVPGLDVVTAGHHDPQTVSCLLDFRLQELLAAVKRDYDVVVLDTPPVLSTPEALLASRTADGVVLSVMREVSRLPVVRTCTDRLAAMNVRVLGAVVTGEAPPRYHSS